jgi:hypothetical protein
VWALVTAPTNAPRLARWRQVADGFLFAAEPAGRLRATRIGLASIIAVRLGFGPFSDLAGQPDALFQPVWFLTPLHGMPALGVIVAVQVVGIAAAALVVIGWRERGTFFAAWLSLLFLAGLRGSRGKIQHNELLLLLACAAILLAPAARRLLDRRASWRFGWPVHTAMAVIATVYFLTGFQKIVGSGPAWVLGDNMRNVMYLAARSPKPPTDAVALFVADRAWLAHLVAAATLVIELGFPSVLVWPRCRPYFVVAAVVLHTSIYLTHGLDYSAWGATTAVILIDWSAVAVAVSQLDLRRSRSPSVSPSSITNASSAATQDS